MFFPKQNQLTIWNRIKKIFGWKSYSDMVSVTAKVEEELEDGSFQTLVEATVKVKADEVDLQRAKQIAFEAATSANVQARKQVKGISIKKLYCL
jgi:hypothetical protein